MIPVIHDAHFSKSPPLGLAYIASNLEKNGIEVKIIDSPNLGLSRSDVLAQVRGFKPDFIGISVTMQSYKSACQHLEEIKKFLPMCKFVFGGPIVTFESEKMMRETKDLDFCIRREGEEAMVDLIKSFVGGKPLQNVLGLTWRKAGKVIKNDDRKLIHDLDQLPYPARHLLPMKVYRGPTDLGGGKPFATMIASRGCLFKCRFCAARVLWKTQRRRKVEKVLDEMELLSEKYKIHYLHFPDDLLLANRAYALELCQGVVRRGLQKIHWSCNGRINLIDK